MHEASIWNVQYIYTPDGFQLITKSLGSGSPLLLIHGAAVDSEFFTDFACEMAQEFQVITFDRRGYGESCFPFNEDGSVFQYPEKMTGREYYTMQAEDACQVLRHYASDQKAVVLGCSAGAIVAMHLSVRHPECIQKLFLHEPPAYILMKDHEDVWNTINRIKESIRIRRYNSALNQFILFVTASRESKKELTQHEIDTFMDNGLNFIRNEYLRTFTDNILPERLLENISAMILCGLETGDAPLGIAAMRIAKQFELPVALIPGSHNGVRDNSEDFAEAFRKLL